MLRWLRGILGTSVLWAAAWIPLGLVVTCIWVAVENNGSIPLSAIPYLAAAFAKWGAVSGAGFGVMLSIAEARGSVGTLKPGRIAAWGAIGAGLLTLSMPLVIAGFNASVLTTVIGAGLGALCAGGTLVAARRAPQLQEKERLALEDADPK